MLADSLTFGELQGEDGDSSNGLLFPDASCGLFAGVLCCHSAEHAGRDKCSASFGSVPSNIQVLQITHPRPRASILTDPASAFTTASNQEVNRITGFREWKTPNQIAQKTSAIAPVWHQRSTLIRCYGTCREGQKLDPM